MQEIKLSSQSLNKLYEAIGKEPGLEKILLKFYENMSQDIIIGFFFDGKDLVKIARKQKEFLMRAWGVSQSYSGKSPKAAHEKLAPILVGHFDRRLRILEDTLREFKVPEQYISFWVNFEGKFRAAVQKD